MSWWKYKGKNDHGEHEITFASQQVQKVKAVEKVCCEIIGMAVKTPEDIAVVVRCKDCRHFALEFEHVGHCRYAGIYLDHMEYGFCSYGERKDGGQ